MTAKLGVLSRRASVEGSDRYELPRTVRRALQQREGEQRKSSPTDHIDLSWVTVIGGLRCISTEPSHKHDVYG